MLEHLVPFGGVIWEGLRGVAFFSASWWVRDKLPKLLLQSPVLPAATLPTMTVMDSIALEL